MMSRRHRQPSMYNQMFKVAKSYASYDPTGKHLRSAYNYAVSKPKNTAPAQPLRGKTTHKRKRRKKYKSKQGRKVDRCQSAIKTLRQESDASLGTMTARFQSSRQILAAQNKQQVLDLGLNSTLSLESVASNLKFFDPSNPGTLITADQSLGNYQRNILFKSITVTATIRNNYQADCKLKVYYCSAKDDTDQTPEQAWAASGPDGGNLTSTSDLLQYPTDYNLFNDLYKAKVVFNGNLSPGQSCTVSNNEKDIEYDPATVDSHNLLFQKEYKAGSFLVVVQGSISHGTTGSAVGYSQAGVDAIVKTTYVVKYNAGVNISFIYASNSTDTMVAPLQSHQPVSNNIAYAQA